MPGGEASVAVDRQLLEDCISFIEAIKDKKVRAQKCTLLDRLNDSLRPKEQVDSNGLLPKVELGSNEELYMSADDPAAPQDKDKSPNESEPDGELYSPMNEVDLKSGYVEQDYVVVDEAMVDDTKTQLSVSQPSPTASTENLSISDKNKKELTKKSSSGKLKQGDRKRSADSTGAISMPEKTSVAISGYLDYKAGKFGSFVKHWAALSSASVYLAKNEDDTDAVKVILLMGKTVDRSKNQFELKNKKEKYTFKVDPSGSIGKWVSSIQEAILGTSQSSSVDPPSLEQLVESSSADQQEGGEEYLPMDFEEQTQESPPVMASPTVNVDEDNYMVPDRLEGESGLDPGRVPSIELEEDDEYDDVESVRQEAEQYRAGVSGGQLSATPQSPISPSPSSENVGGEKRRMSNILGRAKKNRSSDSTSQIAMPDKASVLISGYLEKAGKVIGSTKYWAVLSSSTLFLSKSEEDTETSKAIILSGGSVVPAKSGFELKCGKDKHTFKAESAELVGEWLSHLHGILADLIPEDGSEDGSEERKDSDAESPPEEAQELYDDVESAINDTPGIEVSKASSVGGSTPSHRPLDSPLPTLPPSEDTASATASSKAKTILKGFKDRLKLKDKPTRSSSPMPTGTSIMKCGPIYMYKKHTFGGGEWEKRYCAITGEGNLYYSNKDDDAECQDKIVLQGHTDKIKTKDALGDKKVAAHPFLLLLARNTFAFTSDKERHDWMDDMKYSTAAILEIDSDEEDESTGGYNVQTGTLQEPDDCDDGDIYEAFDDVTPQPLSTTTSSSKIVPDVPAPRTSRAGQPPPPPPSQPEGDAFEGELYEEFESAEKPPALPPSRAPQSTGPALPTRVTPPAPTGPNLPPRGNQPSSGPSLPPRNLASSQPLPPLPSSKNQDPDPVVEDIYDDTCEEPAEVQEIYDDVESSLAAPTPPPASTATSTKGTSPSKQKNSPITDKKFGGLPPKNQKASSPKAPSKGPASTSSPKTAKGLKGTSKASPKQSPKTKNSPKSSPAKSKQPTPPANEDPEEIYDDVSEDPVQNVRAGSLSTNSTAGKNSPLLKRTTKAPSQPAPVEDECEEMYDDVDSALAQVKQSSTEPPEDPDDLYMVTDNADVTQPINSKSDASGGKQPSSKKGSNSSPSTARSYSPSPSSTPPMSSRGLNPPKAANTAATSSGRNRLQSSGKVADMMRKFQQGDGGSEIKCKGLIGYMAPGKRAFQKFWCQLEGSTMCFYQSSRESDKDPLSKFDASECNLSPHKEDFEAKFAFKLSVGSVSHKLSCTSKRDMDKWTMPLKEGVKSCDLE